MENMRDGLVVQWTKPQSDSDMEARYRSSNIGLRVWSMEREKRRKRKKLIAEKKIMAEIL